MTRAPGGPLRAVLGARGARWAATVMAAAIPLAALPNPTPGTAKQVAALVAAAPGIKALPAKLTPPLPRVNADQPLTYFASLAPCITTSTTPPKCVFGDTNGAQTMVLFGDSHAYMWFATLDAIAKSAKWRLVFFANLGCPVADVTVWNVSTNSPNTSCPPFRTAIIQRINGLNPKLVVMAESAYTLDAQDQPITNAEWTAALEQTFAALHSTRMKKVLLGETVLLPDPNACLAANESSIQTCSRAEANPTAVAQRAAEKAAATASKVSYVNVVPWTCSATCTAVIGNMAVYYSSGHLTTTYALYLKTVLHSAIATLLK